MGTAPWHTVVCPGCQPWQDIRHGKKCYPSAPSPLAGGCTTFRLPGGSVPCLCLGLGGGHHLLGSSSSFGSQSWSSGRSLCAPHACKRLSVKIGEGCRRSVTAWRAGPGASAHGREGAVERSNLSLDPVPKSPFLWSLRRPCRLCRSCFSLDSPMKPPLEFYILKTCSAQRGSFANVKASYSSWCKWKRDYLPSCLFMK